MAKKAEVVYDFLYRRRAKVFVDILSAKGEVAANRYASRFYPMEFQVEQFRPYVKAEMKKRFTPDNAS